MPNVITFTFIDFTYVDWENGILIDFRIPFSLKNFDNVIALRNSRDIKLVK